MLGESRLDGVALPRLPRLPDYPSFHQAWKLSGQPLLYGVIRFADDWMSEFVLFDPTVEPGFTDLRRWRTTVRAQVDPLMSYVEARLPGTAVVPDTVRWGHILTGVALYVSSVAASVYFSLNMSDDADVERVTYILMSVLGPLGGVRTLVSYEVARVRNDIKVVLPTLKVDDSLVDTAKSTASPVVGFRLSFSAVFLMLGVCCGFLFGGAAGRGIGVILFGPEAHGVTRYFAGISKVLGAVIGIAWQPLFRETYLSDIARTKRPNSRRSLPAAIP
jgi:hypothetical protein